MITGTTRRLFFGCYLSLFARTATASPSPRTLARLILPLASSLSASALSTRNTMSMATDAKAADLAEGAQDLFAQTPLIHSQPLSKLVGKPVYLKLDALQASGSFKVSTIWNGCNNYSF